MSRTRMLLQKNWTLVTALILVGLSFAESLPARQLHTLMTDGEHNSAFGPSYPRALLTENDAYQTSYLANANQDTQASANSSACPLSIRRRFEAYGEEWDMQLMLSPHIAPDLDITSGDPSDQPLSRFSTSGTCAYQARTEDLSAAVHTSKSNLELLRGYLYKNGSIYRLSPVPRRLAKRFLDEPTGEPHLLFRVHRQADTLDDRQDDELPEDTNVLAALRKAVSRRKSTNSCAINIKDECPNGRCKFDTTYKPGKRPNAGQLAWLTEGAPTATIELAIFVDADACNTFTSYLGTEDALREFLLTFIDQIALIFHLPSFLDSVDIKIVYMHLLKQNPTNIPEKAGIESVLAAFSDFQKDQNKPEEDPQHWDHAVLLTGKKMYRGDFDYSVMGMSRVGAMCHPLYSATVAELGATDNTKSAIQSSGFLSSYMVAHEIAHNLGLFHDGEQNDCSSEKYIMSPARRWEGQTEWSTCSRDAIKAKIGSRMCLFETDLIPPKADLDYGRLNKLPGQIYSANSQCAMQMKNKRYIKDPNQSLATICNSLKCRQTRGLAVTEIGPALDGTYCGNGKWCSSGDCVPWPLPQPVVQPGWSSWTTGSCDSGCVDASLGYKINERSCNHPEPQNTESNCSGRSYEVLTCDDTFVSPLTSKTCAVSEIRAIA
ncbi:hypothetical protein RvY_04945-2 [Ramazzottius varieornatus]|uniref:Peptidase M12B domain-containing protein n=1 Tax=Ramazzottius varieornatus TaxID=947166 RepID=A0A1D1UTC6_RAMVA|nr:hypothetical protein RvY_04945-2 [Ramazzottius varieornatus]